MKYEAQFKPRAVRDLESLAPEAVRRIKSNLEKEDYLKGLQNLKKV